MKSTTTQKTKTYKWYFFNTIYMLGKKDNYIILKKKNQNSTINQFDKI